MDVLEKYSNKKIILDDDGLVKYYVEPFPFTEDEGKLLQNAEKLFTQVEIEAVRREPDIALRKTVLQEYLKIKTPDSKNREILIDNIINRVMGYGVLSDLVMDPNLEEIMVNGVNMPVYVFHKKYGMCPTNISFEEREGIFKIINKLCWINNKDMEPIMDMSMLDGNRVNITSDPIAIHGPSMTIRKQKKSFYGITELIYSGTLDADLAALLWLSTDGMKMSPANIVIAGMIGSGKTTLLNALVSLTPPEDRIITIEETPELQLGSRGNWVPLTCQKGYDMEALVRNTLRMRPNKIVVGEIRGSEAMALFNAMNVGHKGMGTLHASSSREVISRLESPPMNVPTRVITNLDLIVVMGIFNYKGVPIRRVTEVSEVGGREGDTILLGNIYQWDPKKDGCSDSEGRFPTTYLDKLASKLKISKREVVDELTKRRAVLIDLVERKVFDQKELMAAIGEFHRSECEIGQSDVVKDLKKALNKK